MKILKNSLHFFAAFFLLQKQYMLIKESMANVDKEKKTAMICNVLPKITNTNF